MKIYPILCQLKSENETETKTANILSVSHNGLVLDSLETPLLVNKTYTVQLTFPLIDESGDAEAVVVKTYVKLQGTKPKAVCI